MIIFSTVWAGVFNSDYLGASDYPHASLKEIAVIKPSDTVMFGEKKNIAASADDPLGAADYYMDMFEGGSPQAPTGNDWDRIEHGCHSVVRIASGCRRLQLFLCGRQRAFRRYGGTVWPLNLWAVSDDDRSKNAFRAP